MHVALQENKLAQQTAVQESHEVKRRYLPADSLLLLDPEPVVFDPQPPRRRLGKHHIAVFADELLGLNGNGPVAVDLLLAPHQFPSRPVQVQGEPADVGDVTEAVLNFSKGEWERRG